MGHTVVEALLRRKYLLDTDVTTTELERCLSTIDLTLLGVGSTLGLGIYVLAGQVASRIAGPSVILSFLIAAVASVFSALCYAEFGARVPRAGSAYVYSYCSVGEFMAFVIGWNLVLEYVIGTASVARGYSGYLDYLLNGTMQRHLTEYMPINVTGLSSYPDFLAFGITILLTVMLAIGVRESTRFNNYFTGLNLLVVMYAVVTGSFKASFSNWQLSPDQVPANAGHGGFMPFGFGGVMAGAAMCFYGYVGFDCIATTGEEVQNPQKAIPRSIIASLSIVFAAYFGISAIQTLMWPYYDQYQSAPLPYVFERVGWPVARWIISLGALSGLSTSLLGSMFPLPRILYAMGTDGLIFEFLAKVHPRFKTPMIATFISGFFAAAMAMMFDVHELAAMMSIGTLLAYTLVSVSVLLLRYRILSERVHLQAILGPCPSAPPITSLQGETESLQKPNGEDERKSDSSIGVESFPDAIVDLRNRSMSASASTMLTSTHHYTTRDVLKMLVNWDGIEVQTTMTSTISICLIGLICFTLLLLNLLLVNLQKQLFELEVWVLVLVSIVLLVVFFLGFALYRQPSERQELLFRVPFVPALPIMSVFINIYLMLNLSISTWIRFTVWMIIGLAIYFGYGISHSKERKRRAPVLPCIYESEVDSEENNKTERSPLLSRKS